MISSLVRVHWRNSLLVNETVYSNTKYLDIVINANKDFVLVSRIFILSTLCNLTIIIISSTTLDTKIVYIYLLGFAIIKYDVSLV